VAFKEKYEHVLVPYFHPETKPLARWCREIRVRKTLSDWERTELEALGFCFDPAAILEENKKLKEQLLSKQQEEQQQQEQQQENPAASNESATAEGEGKSEEGVTASDAPMSAAKKVKLFMLRNAYSLRKSFDERLQELMAFKQEFGHCLVPNRYKPNHSLGEWVTGVRRGHVKITKEERKKLNQVGFNWEHRNNRFEREWMERLDRLKAYKRMYGDCHVPYQWSVDPQLSEWCNTQRKRNNKGILLPDRKQMLDALGFVWGSGAGGSGASANKSRRRSSGEGAATAMTTHSGSGEEEDNHRSASPQPEPTTTTTTETDHHDHDGGDEPRGHDDPNHQAYRAAAMAALLRHQQLQQEQQQLLHNHHHQQQQQHLEHPLDVEEEEDGHVPHHDHPVIDDDDPMPASARHYYYGIL